MASGYYDPGPDYNDPEGKPYRSLKPELTKTQKRLRARAKAAKKARRLHRKLAN